MMLSWLLLTRLRMMLRLRSARSGARAGIAAVGLARLSVGAVAGRAAAVAFAATTGGRAAASIVTAATTTAPTTTSTASTAAFTAFTALATLALFSCALTLTLRRRGCFRTRGFLTRLRRCLLRLLLTRLLLL